MKTAQEIKKEKAIDLITGALPYVDEQINKVHLERLCKYIDSYLDGVFIQFKETMDHVIDLLPKDAQSAAQPPVLSAEDITESLRNSYFKETGEQALTNDYALWCENKIVEHRQYIQQPQPPYGREYFEWVKAFENGNFNMPKEKRVNIRFKGNASVMYNHDETGWAFDDYDGMKVLPGDWKDIEWLERTTLPAQVEGEWHSKFSGNVETDQHKIWEHILKLWSEHKDTTFDFIHEMKDKFTLIQNYAYDDKLENTLPAPQGYTKSQMYDCALQFFYHWFNQPGNNTEQVLQEWLPTFLASLSPAPEQGDAVGFAKFAVDYYAGQDIWNGVND